MSLLLLLSDLHLGDVRDEDIPDDFKSDIPPLKERTTRYTILKETLKQLASRIKEEKEQLDAVIISGDITVANDENGFQKLDEVLSWLGDVIPSQERIVVVPGNHDVKWQVAGDSPAKYELFIKHIRAKGFTTPLLEGIDIKDGNVVAANLKNHYIVDPDRRWAIVPINSSHYCGSVEPIVAIPEAIWGALPVTIAAADGSLSEAEIRKELCHLRLRDVARICAPDQLQAISQLATAIDSEVAGSPRRPVLIGVIHHHLLPVSVREEFKPFESITNLGHLRYILACHNFSIVLHGHKHTDCVYYDHIQKPPAGDGPSLHRILVVSSPSVKTPGAKPENICRLLRIPDQAHASSVLLGDVSSVEHGAQLHLPDPTVFRLWQTAPEGLFKSSPVNLVEGNSVDQVYERALALFQGIPSSKLLPNVICRVGQTANPVTLPAAYPQVPDIADAERAAWFKKIVDWWQKRAFSRLSGDHHFNHGSRIHRYGRNVSQLDRVIEAIKRDRGTSRGVITLLNPYADDPQQESSRFPSFCFVQFLIRDLVENYSLEVIGYFRKQEIKYWWPVNLAELAQLQAGVLRRVKGDVEGGKPKQLTAGIITTIAATAHVGKRVPYILVPAIDFDLEESPQKLWDMTYAVCWPEMKDRVHQVTTWQNVLKNLMPPTEQESDGVRVAIQGVEYLGEIAGHFARNHGGGVEALAERWRELEKINREHINTMTSGEAKAADEAHTEWRKQVLIKLNQITSIVNHALSASIAELK